VFHMFWVLMNYFIAYYFCCRSWIHLFFFLCNLHGSHKLCSYNVSGYDVNQNVIGGVF
jgi:hypothetical protein